RGSENPKDRRAYEALRSSIRDFNFSANEQRKLSARSYVWSLVYGVMGIRTNGVRIEVTKKFLDIAQNTINDINKYIKDKNTIPETRKSLESKLPAIKKSLSDFEHKLEELNYSYEKQREHYNKLLIDGRDYPSDLLLEQLAMVKQDIKGDDRFSVELSQCFMTAQKNLELVVTKKENPTTIKRAELENYPKN
ncbi:MAG: hypothetical protein LBF22_02350, partial [Deltaproteobacteria bacterium]|nr:hypothetical protein [Deltaproteobacteria bacterium]